MAAQHTEEETGRFFNKRVGIYIRYECALAPLRLVSIVQMSQIQFACAITSFKPRAPKTPYHHWKF